MAKIINGVATGHELTSFTAREILKAGGNAFDAAIAAYLSMFVTEPCMASAGAAGFATTYQDGKCKFYDFFCQTPKSKASRDAIDFYPITVDFGNEQEVFHVGLASAAVPGTIAGIFKIHQDLGKLPFKELIAIPCQLATEGVPLNTFQAYDVKLLAPIAKNSFEGQRLFFKNDEPKIVGDKISIPELPDFLHFLAEEGSEGFYKGEIGRKIAYDAQNKGGFLSRKDFEEYKVIVKNPVVLPYQGLHLQLPNLPSLGGMLMGVVLHAKDKSLESNLIYTNTLLKNTDYLKTAFEERTGLQINEGIFNTNFKGTSHLNVIDSEGQAISLTTSMGEGSGYFMPGTGQQLNNMLGESFLLPEGFHNWKEDTRMSSMMSPTMILNGAKELVFAGGSGGASRIPFAIAQVIKNIYESKMSLTEAIEAPRMHFQDDIMNLENESLLDQIKNKGSLNIWNKKSIYFGGVHALAKINDDWFASGDSRREGHGEVF